MYDITTASGNLHWVPDIDGKRHTEKYSIDVPETLPPGEYTLKLKLRSPESDRDVLLALDQQILERHGFYRIGTIRLEK